MLRPNFMGKKFVPTLYHNLAFEGFDDLRDFLESINCQTSKSCQVRGSNPMPGSDPSCLSVDQEVKESSQSGNGFGIRTSRVYGQRDWRR